MGYSQKSLFYFSKAVVYGTLDFFRLRDPRRTVIPVDVQEIRTHGEYILGKDKHFIALRSNSDGIFINLSHRRHLWHEVEITDLLHASRRNYLC